MAAIFTNASLGLGLGTGRSTSVSTSGPPVFCTWMAFMTNYDDRRTMQVANGKCVERHPTLGHDAGRALAVTYLVRLPTRLLARNNFRIARQPSRSACQERRALLQSC